MAGDWIKFEFETFEKPEVLQMAAELDIPEQHVVGGLLAIWGWFNRHTTDGTCNAASVTDVTLDRFANVTGFAKAMRKVGWLSEEDGKIVMPNFYKHNSNCAKKRALTNKRVAELRSNAASVTKALPEKRREDIKKPHTSYVSKKAQTDTNERAKKAWKPPPEVDQQAWDDFEKHRTDIRQPLTDRARTIAAGVLSSLQPQQQRQCVELTIQHRWRGLFPEKVKPDEAHQRNRNDVGRSFIDAKFKQHFGEDSGSSVCEVQGDLRAPLDEPMDDGGGMESSAGGMGGRIARTFN